MDEKSLVPQELIESKIFLIRGKKVMLDRDLSVLYGVETKVLKQTVKRNPKRFPDDFMFELNQEELKNWRSQFVTSKADRMGLRYPPYAFTENGVAMLSSILNSEKAILINIQIMRTFTRLREIMASHKELARRLGDLEKKYDGQFKIVFDALRSLMAPPVKQKRKIGFDLKEKQARYGRKKILKMESQTRQTKQTRRTRKD